MGKKETCVLDHKQYVHFEPDLLNTLRMIAKCDFTYSALNFWTYVVNIMLNIQCILIYEQLQQLVRRIVIYPHETPHRRTLLQERRSSLKPRNLASPA